MKITDVTVSTEPNKWGLVIETEEGDLFAPHFELIELNEDATMFMNDPLYYRSALMELAEEWLASDYNTAYVYPFGHSQGFVNTKRQ